MYQWFDSHLPGFGGFRCFFRKNAKTRGTTYDGFSGQFFRIFEIIFVCFVVAMSDLVQDVEAIHGLH